MAACASILTLAAYSSLADGQMPAAAKPDKTYTGTVISVNPNERTMEVKGFVTSHTFHLGADCPYVSLDNPSAAISDLRPGEKVNVTYLDARGVLVANHIQQEAMADTGAVKAMDPTAHTVTLQTSWGSKVYQLPDGCNIVLRGGKSGTLADIKTGSYVTVTYEMPSGKPTARQIAQTSQSFTGTLTAVDTIDRTVKAESMLTSKTFHLADNCAIVINGKVSQDMRELKLGSRMEFSYDDVNGVNVANRIGPTTQQNSVPAAEQSMATQ
jgi:Cu/Ag efflux protein CusF